MRLHSACLKNIESYAHGLEVLLHLVLLWKLLMILDTSFGFKLVFLKYSKKSDLVWICFCGKVSPIEVLSSFWGGDYVGASQILYRGWTGFFLVRPSHMPNFKGKERR